MAGISANPKHAVKGGGFGAQEGFWEIGKASSVVHQYPPNKAGQQSDPQTMVRLELFKLDAKTLERHADDEPVLEHLGVGRKNTLEKVRPGNMSGPDDDAPEDLGNELGTEGNTFFVEEGTTFHEACSFIKFVSSAVEKGFKAELLDKAYLTVLEGTKFEVERLKGFKPDGADPAAKEPTSLGVKKILLFGYEKKKTVAGKVASKPTAKAPAAAKEPTAEEAAEIPNVEAVVEALGDIAKDKANKPAFKRTLLQASVMTILQKKTKLSMKEKADVIRATVQNDDWLLGHAAEQGFVVDVDAGTVEFPS